MNEYEALRDQLLSGDMDSVKPQSRNEAALKNAIASVGMEGLQKPQSRMEAYLAAFAERVKGVPYDTRKTENIVIPVTFPSDAKRVVINVAEIAEVYIALNHISDFVPSYDEFLSGVYYLDAQGAEMKVSDDNPALTEEGGVTFYHSNIIPTLVVAKNTFDPVFLPEGVYEFLPCDSEGNIDEQQLANAQAYGAGHISFTHTTGELKTLDPKFLPEGVGGGQSLYVDITPYFASYEDMQSPPAADGTCTIEEAKALINRFGSGSVLGIERRFSDGDRFASQQFTFSYTERFYDGEDSDGITGLFSVAGAAYSFAVYIERGEGFINIVEE